MNCLLAMIEFSIICVLNIFKHTLLSLKYFERLYLHIRGIHFNYFSTKNDQIMSHCCATVLGNVLQIAPCLDRGWPLQFKIYSPHITQILGNLELFKKLLFFKYLSFLYALIWAVKILFPLQFEYIQSTICILLSCIE